MATCSTEEGWIHSALALTHALSSDIYPELFDLFFTHPVFERWCQGGVGWQLHCVGGPGTGKTTLVALAIRYLRVRFQPHGYPVISAFVRQCVIDHEAEFLEDFLATLYRSLGSHNVCEDDGTEVWYQDYVKALSEVGGSGLRHRLELIRDALRLRLQNIKKNKSLVFMVIDGLDNCSASLQLLLDGKLRNMQSYGVHVMVTLRAAIYDNWHKACDHPAHRSERNGGPAALQLYYVCEECEDVLCFPCKAAGRICDNCQTNDLLCENYDRVTVDIQPSSHSLENFIAWDLEREHGDLGLGSSAQKPPLSSLGLSLKRDHPGNVLGIVANIHSLAEGHIGLAKARLDLIHAAQSVEEIKQHRYQLPSNIVSIFDAGIKAVEAQSPHHRDLGMRAIAAAGSKFAGLTVPYMQRLLQKPLDVKIRSGEDITDSTKGFLIATTDNPKIIRVFHRTFYRFIVDRYNEKLHNANMELVRSNQENKHKASYHEARLKRAVGARFEPRIVADVPTDVTPAKLSRTLTMMEKVSEEPLKPYVLRQGTRVWH